eukprot:1255418-Pyramimonas_sp.AAC.1
MKYQLHSEGRTAVYMWSYAYSISIRNQTPGHDEKLELETYGLVVPDVVLSSPNPCLTRSVPSIVQQPVVINSKALKFFALLEEKEYPNAVTCPAVFLEVHNIAPTGPYNQ